MSDDAYEMTFGKYRGTPIGEVPAGYLLWLWDNGLWDSHVRGAEADPVRQYIIKHFAALETECPDMIVFHRP
jgi:Putative quorum-sensing-regulated virulence factor